jgi:hypothetical protein
MLASVVADVIYPMSAQKSAHIPTQVLNIQGGKMAAGMTKTQLVRHMAEKL